MGVAELLDRMEGTLRRQIESGLTSLQHCCSFYRFPAETSAAEAASTGWLVTLVLVYYFSVDT